MDKLKIWDERAKTLAQTHPLKNLGHLPNIPGITPETSRFLRWKSLVYLLRHDTNHIFKRYFWKHPFKYTWNILKSYARKKSSIREGDFFLYNFSSIEEFQKSLRDRSEINFTVCEEKSGSDLDDFSAGGIAPHTSKEKSSRDEPNFPSQTVKVNSERSLTAPLVVVGFSYCHKPLECPSGRFTDQCIHDENHPVCGQCFIGKAVHALPTEQTKVFFIPTVHYIGEQFFKLLETYRADEIVFLITACELTLEMFGDWGNMLNLRGLGVRLDGRICNTMKAFELSEVGIKPGLTIVRDETQAKILELIRLLRQ